MRYLGEVGPSEAFWGGRDLHEHVVAAHCGPQGAGHVRGCCGVTGQPGVDLDGDPPVCCGCLLVNQGQDVTGGADVIGGDREDGSLGAGTQLGQVTQLGVIPVALRQGRGEDRGVGRHADDVPAGDERLELAAGEQLTGKVVQPYRHAQGGQFGKRVMADVTGHVRAFRIGRAVGGAAGGRGKVAGWPRSVGYNRSRLVRRLEGRPAAGQAMTASIVFFSALGWAGDLGAFFRACSSLDPSS